MTEEQISHREFRRTLVRAIVFPLLLMALLAGALLWQINRMLTLSQWVEHTDEVIAQANLAEKLLVDIETGRRGYLLTGKPEFLEPYNEASTRVAPTFDRLRQLVSDNPVQTRRLDDIGAILPAWLEYGHELIVLRDTGGDYSARMAGGEGRRRMSMMRAEFADFIKEEENLRATRAGNAQGGARSAILVSVVLAILLGGLLAFVARRQLYAVSNNYRGALALTNEQGDALRASEQKYRSLTEVLPQQVWTAQPDGALDYVNQRTLDYFGSTSEKVLGAGWQAVVHRDDLSATMEHWSKSLRTGEPYETEFRLRREPDAQYRWHIGRALPIRDASGEIVKWIGTNTDITEHKRATAELLRRSRQSSLGADIGVALAGSDTLQNILQRCSAAMVEHLDAAFARIWTLNETEQMLELQASAGMYTHLDGAHGRVPVGEFKIGRIAASRQPHLTNSVVGDAEVGDQEWARREGMVSFAGYPLLVGGRLLGVMAMFARHPLADDALEALASVSNTIAQGIERKRVETQLARLGEERERMLEEVSTPVVPVLPGVLVLPLIGSLDTLRMSRATEAALGEVRRTGASACIIDITGARIVDSHAVANLGNLVSALRLIGAEAIVTGVSAHAAQSLVGLGLDLQGMRTHRTLAQALAALIQTRGVSNGNQ
ncbi:MAG: CHASE3 domain-containing protein [Pyrinomonadaceae bacterium]